MEQHFDICVDYDMLIELEAKLKRIEKNLNSSAEQMVLALHNSQAYLEGNQFNKAYSITETCTGKCQKIADDLNSTIKYLDELMNVLDAYEKCTYNGGSV